MAYAPILPESRQNTSSTLGKRLANNGDDEDDTELDSLAAITMVAPGGSEPATPTLESTQDIPYPQDIPPLPVDPDILRLGHSDLFPLKWLPLSAPLGLRAAGMVAHRRHDAEVCKS